MIPLVRLISAARSVPQRGVGCRHLVWLQLGAYLRTATSGVGCRYSAGSISATSSGVRCHYSAGSVSAARSSVGCRYCTEGPETPSRVDPLYLYSLLTLSA